MTRRCFSDELPAPQRQFVRKLLRFAGHAASSTERAEPRPEVLFDEQMRTTVSDRRTTMDAAARLSVTAAGCIPLTVWLLWHSGWWLLLTALLAAMAWLAYIGSVHAAIAYGECVTTEKPQVKVLTWG